MLDVMSHFVLWFHSAFCARAHPAHSQNMATRKRKASAPPDSNSRALRSSTTAQPPAAQTLPTATSRPKPKPTARGTANPPQSDGSMPPPTAKPAVVQPLKPAPRTQGSIKAQTIPPESDQAKNHTDSSVFPYDFISMSLTTLSSSATITGVKKPKKAHLKKSPAFVASSDDEETVPDSSDLAHLPAAALPAEPLPIVPAADPAALASSPGVSGHCITHARATHPNIQQSPATSLFIVQPHFVRSLLYSCLSAADLFTDWCFLECGCRTCTWYSFVGLCPHNT